MKKIITIFKKDLKLLLNNKFSWFMLFLAPIFIILIMGFLFNNQNSYNIHIGTYSQEESLMYKSYIENLKNDNFKVTEYKSQNLCLDSIKKGLINVCIFFPNDFNLNNNKTNLVDIKIDSSKNNLKNVVNNLILNSLDDKSKFYQIDNTQALIDVIYVTEFNSVKEKEILSQLKNITNNLKSNSKDLNLNLIYLKSIFNSDSLDVSEISKNTENLKEKIENYVEKSELTIIQIQTNLDNLTSTIVNISSDSSSLIKDIEEDLNQIDINLNSLKSIYDLGLVSSKLDKLESELEKSYQNFDKLYKKIDDLTKNILNKTSTLENQIKILEENNNKTINSIATIKVKDSQNIVKPIEINIEPVTDSSTYLSPLIPSLIASLIFIITIILSSNLILSEKQNRAYFRNFLSQSKSFEYIIGNFLTLSFIIFMQIFFIMISYFLMIKKSINLDFITILLLCVPIISVFVLIGMFIGNISNSQETNIILSFIVIFIMFAFSGLLLPVEILSQKLINITNLNPYLISESILRKFILFSANLSDLKFDLLILGLYLVIFLIINIIIESYNKKQLIYKLCYEIELKFRRKK